MASCSSYSYYGGCNNSIWSNWVRWLVLALIILAAFFIFFLFSCLTARRRRRAGLDPYRGTGWAAGRTPPGHGAATYNAQPHYGQPQQEQPMYNNSNHPAPPAYSPSNAGYYGNQGNDVELQQPQQAYGANSRGDHYAPPPGPPPPKM